MGRENERWRESALGRKKGSVVGKGSGEQREEIKEMKGCEREGGEGRGGEGGREAGRKWAGRREGGREGGEGGDGG